MVLEGYLQNTASLEESRYTRATSILRLVITLLLLVPQAHNVVSVIGFRQIDLRVLLQFAAPLALKVLTLMAMRGSAALKGDPIVFAAQLFYAYIRGSDAWDTCKKVQRQGEYMTMTGRAEFQQQMQQYLAGDAEHDQAMVDGLLSESIVTAQERIIKYLRAMVLNTPNIDNQRYKDLTFCIEAVAKGDLGKLDTTNIRSKMKRAITQHIPDLDGLAWATGQDMTTAASLGKVSGLAAGSKGATMLTKLRGAFMGKVRDVMNGK